MRSFSYVFIFVLQVHVTLVTIHCKWLDYKAIFAFQVEYFSFMKLDEVREHILKNKGLLSLEIESSSSICTV